MFKFSSLLLSSALTFISANELHPIVETPPLATITDKVFFDIAINGEPLGRIVFGLFGDVVPKTVENFKGLSQCNHGEGKKDAYGIDLCYRSSPFHRIIPGFMA